MADNFRSDVLLNKLFCVRRVLRQAMMWPPTARIAEVGRANRHRGVAECVDLRPAALVGRSPDSLGLAGVADCS